MDYLRWAKVHEKVRYELAISGMPAPNPEEFDLTKVPAPLVSSGSYGHPDLIDAISRRYAIAPNRVVPVPGTSSGNFIALAACANHADRVVLERPVYEPVRRAARFLGFQVVDAPRLPGRDFELSLEAVEGGLRGGSRAVFLTNLHNPSGQYIPPGRMREVSELCARYHASLIVDEVYLDSAALTTGEPLWTAANLGEHVVTINSLTKVYGLPGLRVGWVLAGPAVAERARNIMDMLSVDNASPSAALAIEAFRRIDRLEARFREFHARGQGVFRPWLLANAALGGYDNHGAIFECLRLPEGVTGERLCTVLRARHETQLTPGRFFDLDDHVRLSLTLPAEELEEALSRVSRALREARG